MSHVLILSKDRKCPEIERSGSIVLSEGLSFEENKIWMSVKWELCLT